MTPEIKCRRAVVNLNLQEIQALNNYRIAYGRRGFKCARSAMEKVIEAWKVAGAENATTTKKSLAVGNAAAMREALLEARKVIKAMGGYWATETLPIIDAALAKPPRNCDKTFGADSPIRNADEAWLVFKNHNHDAYFDVPGLLRCIDWLLAPAAERKENPNEQI